MKTTPVLLLCALLTPLGMPAEDLPTALILVRVSDAEGDESSLDPTTQPLLRQLTLDGVHLPSVSVDQPVGDSSELWRLSDSLAGRLRTRARVAVVRAPNSSAPDAKNARALSDHVNTLRELSKSLDDPGPPTSSELEFLSIVGEILRTDVSLPASLDSPTPQRLPTEVRIRRERDKGAQIVLTEVVDDSLEGDGMRPPESLLASLESMPPDQRNDLHIVVLSAVGGRASASVTLHGPALRRGWVINTPATVEGLVDLLVTLVTKGDPARLPSPTLREVFRHAK